MLRSSLVLVCVMMYGAAGLGATKVKSTPGGGATTGATEQVQAAPTHPGKKAAPAAAPALSVEKQREPMALGLTAAPKLGVTIPSSKLATTYLAGLEATYDVRPLRDLFGLWRGASVAGCLEFDYLAPGYAGRSTTPAVGDYTYTLQQRLMIVLVEALVRYPVFGIEPYGGLGYGWYMLRARMDAFGQTNTESQVRSGMQVRGGVGYRLGLGDVFGELRYHYAGLAFRTTGASNAGGFTLGAGYRFVF